METVANNIAESVFDIKKGVKIYIIPPKAGSFYLSMLLWVSGIAVGGIASDSVKGFDLLKVLQKDLHQINTQTALILEKVLNYLPIQLQDLC